jgi:hypothetical protein
MYSPRGEFFKLFFAPSEILRLAISAVGAYAIFKIHPSVFYIVVNTTVFHKVGYLKQVLNNAGTDVMIF